jgi:hypothetical protein
VQMCVLVRGCLCLRRWRSSGGYALSNVVCGPSHCVSMPRQIRSIQTKISVRFECNRGECTCEDKVGQNQWKCKMKNDGHSLCAHDTVPVHSRFTDALSQNRRCTPKTPLVRMQRCGDADNNGGTHTVSHTSVAWCISSDWCERNFGMGAIRAVAPWIRIAFVRSKRTFAAWMVSGELVPSS